MEAIRKMEPAWTKTCGSNFRLTSRTVIQPNGGTREVPCYSLTKLFFCIYPNTFSGNSFLVENGRMDEWTNGRFRFEKMQKKKSTYIYNIYIIYIGYNIIIHTTLSCFLFRFLITDSSLFILLSYKKHQNVHSSIRPYVHFAAFCCRLSGYSQFLGYGSWLESFALQFLHFLEHDVPRVRFLRL